MAVVGDQMRYKLYLNKLIKFFIQLLFVLSCPVLSGFVPPQTRYFSRGFPSEERKKVKEFKD